MLIEENVSMAESNLFFVVLLIVLPFLFLIYKFIRKSSNHLPPGPFAWPIIGNLLHIGKKPHASLAQLAQTHGPIISLRLGTQLLVVGSTPAAAIEILKVHDRVLSARSIPTATPAKNPANTYCSLAWADCTNQWKYLRSICRSELLSIKAIESQTSLREEKVNELVGFLGRKEGQRVKIGELVFAIVFNTLSTILVSKNFIDLEEEKEGEGMKGLARTYVESGATPNLADFYPIFTVFDLQGLKKKSMESFVKICGLWEGIIDERRRGKEEKQSDFLDVLLHNGFTNDQINYLLLELLLAGTDTTTSTIEWAMAELIKNQEAMKNVRIELETMRINGKKAVKESDLPNLPYLHSCVKETLRLHPPGPLLLPHRASETCKVMNLTIPKDSQVFVNLWAIGRDPMTWDDPLAFKPERFRDSSVESSKVNDFGWIPFGAGRRMCPGQAMATKQVELVVASLINCFDWFLPHDMDPSELDMGEKFGITLQKQQPLVLIPKAK